MEQKLLELKDEYNEKMEKLHQREQKLIQEKEQIKENLISDFSNKK